MKLKNCLLMLPFSALLAFGLYHVHSFAGVTEGGVLGASLLLDHLLGLSPAVSGILLNFCCYAFGWRVLGKRFIGYSAISALAFSLAYFVCEQFPPLWPALYEHPLAAALLGALFVGVGVGGCVRLGGAPGGDDALAMTLSHLTHIRIEWLYLITDLTVLALSLAYIPWQRMVYSLLTVVLSGQIIGWIQKLPPRQK